MSGSLPTSERPYSKAEVTLKKKKFHLCLQWSVMHKRVQPATCPVNF